jgi:hypothetical protein
MPLEIVITKVSLLYLNIQIKSLYYLFIKFSELINTLVILALDLLTRQKL